MDFFSHSEVPSLCLRDLQRTTAFRDAIRRAVRPGDVVLDAGAGSGILAMFAAKAGARKVYAVEVDRALSDRLKENAARNGLSSIIEVICEDVRNLNLPEPADVVLAEMIETWLLDELQIPALNALRQHGVIGRTTRVIPGRYDAIIEAGHLDFNCYGFDIPFPVHDWPDLVPDSGWHEMNFREASDRLVAFKADFGGVIDPAFEATVEFAPRYTGTVNALRLSGVAHLDDQCALGPTVAFNGNKIVPIAPIEIREGVPCQLSIAGRRGGEGGLAALRVDTLARTSTT